MAEEQDKSQKTEQPTQKKLDDARNKGKVAFSREVTSFLMILSFTIFLTWSSPYLLNSNSISIGKYISFIHIYSDKLNSSDMVKFVLSIMWDVILLIALPLILSVISILAGAFLQNGFLFAPEALKFDLSRISPLTGLKRIFSMKSLVELLKSIVKIIIFSTAAYMVIAKEIALLKNLQDYDLTNLLYLFFTMTTKMLMTLCVIMACIAGFDLIYQKHDFMENMKMTKQEIKDEFKKTEGNPEVKAKLRAIRMEKSQQRMMSNVPDADVIITNPTHYSIALKYKQDDMGAPIVVAKGIDDVAMRIREVAREHAIPLVENAPLARALYATVELDQEIPFEHYQAVAEIISSIMKMKNKF